MQSPPIVKSLRGEAQYLSPICKVFTHFGVAKLNTKIVFLHCRVLTPLFSSRDTLAMRKEDVRHYVENCVA